MSTVQEHASDNESHDSADLTSTISKVPDNITARQFGRTEDGGSDEEILPDLDLSDVDDTVFKAVVTPKSGGNVNPDPASPASLVVPPPGSHPSKSLSEAAISNRNKKYTYQQVGTKSEIPPKDDQGFSDPFFKDVNKMKTFASSVMMNNGVTPEREFVDWLIRQMGIRQGLYASQIEMFVSGIKMERDNSLISSLADVNKKFSEEVSKMIKSNKDLSDSVNTLKGEVTRLPNLLFEQNKNSLVELVKGMKVDQIPPSIKGKVMIPKKEIINVEEEVVIDETEKMNLIDGFMRKRFSKNDRKNGRIVNAVWMVVGRERLLHYLANAPTKEEFQGIQKAVVDYLKEEARSDSEGSVAFAESSSKVIPKKEQSYRPIGAPQKGVKVENKPPTTTVKRYNPSALI